MRSNFGNIRPNPKIKQLFDVLIQIIVHCVNTVQTAAEIPLSNPNNVKDGSNDDEKRGTFRMSDKFA